MDIERILDRPLYPDEIRHYGVKGMKWGKRLRSTTTNHKAKKDAKRYANAKMFYGEGAGTQRKLLKAELDRKKKNIPGYEKAFNSAVSNANYSKAANRAIAKRKRIDRTKYTKTAVKRAFNITGPITIAAGTALYSANKPAVDRAIVTALNKTVSAVKKASTSHTVKTILKNTPKYYG